MTEELDQRFPYPEWNKGQKGIGWKVIEGEGAHISVGPKVKDIVVPLGAECVLCGQKHDHALRLHEQAHIRFTLDRKGRHPKLPKDIKDIYWQVAEDIRMDKCLRSAGAKVPAALCRYEAPKWKATLKQMNDKGRILWTVATSEADKPLTDKWLKEVCKEDTDKGRMSADDILDIARIAVQKMEESSPRGWVYWKDKATTQKAREAASNYPIACYHGGRWEFVSPGLVTSDHKKRTVEYRPPLANSLKVARWLQNLMEQLGYEQPPPSQQKQKSQGEGDSAPDPETEYDPNVTKPEAEAEAQGITEEEEEQAEEQAKQKQEEEPVPTGDPTSSNPNAWGNTGSWDKFVYEQPYLSRRLPGRLIQQFRPTDIGAVVGGMHRWFTDQKVFKEKRRWPGGVLVVDCSGSMSLTYQQIAEICESVPGVYILLYGSYDGNRGDGLATLRLVGKEGRWADQKTLEYYGGSNGIDGPALVAATKAPVKGPRVWLSDGWVNSGTGTTSDTLRKEVELIIRRNNIIHVNPHFVHGSNGSGNDPKVIERVIDALRSGKGGGRYFVQ